ncbi:MAG: GNAT family N-acetyltransferase [bacterium]
MDGLRIRPCVPDCDDETLLAIVNAAEAGSPDFVPETIEQFRIARQSPDWTADGIFFAELDGIPVGTVTGAVDPHRSEPLGFLAGPSVLPAYRRRGIGTALARHALDYLRSRGMKTARTAIGDWNRPAAAFLAGFGFRPTRRFSLMRRPLANLPSGVGEHPDVSVEDAGASDEAVSLLTRLSNEAFREHFGHRDGTEASRRYWMDNVVAMGFVVRRTIARFSGEAAGFLIHGYYPAENEQLGTSRGGLWSVGVLKAHRNKGIAKRLMLEGMAWLAAQGLAEVELGVDDENITSARRLYERLGFAVVRGSTTYDCPLEPVTGPAR